MCRDTCPHEEAAVSQPPDEPRSSSEPAGDETDEPAGSGTGSPHGGTPPADVTTSEATTSEATTLDAGEAAPEPAPAGGSGEQQPWWTRGQAIRPPGGQQPAPYQPQPAPWGYAQAPSGPPPAGPGWGPPPAPAGAVPAADRDRLSVHLIYEGVLAFIAIVLIVATAATSPHQNLTAAFGQAGYLGLMATGFAFSMRTASPNLAVGAITFFSSSLAAWLISANSWSKPAAFLVAILLSTLIGLLLGFVVAVLSVPSWAATLGAVAVIQAVVLSFAKDPFVPVHFSGGYPTAMWYGLFFVLSVGGGALWLIPGVRKPLSAAREPGEPSRWLGLRTGLGAIAGLTGSSFLAGLAAVPLLMRLQMATTSTATESTFALAAALLGGVSVFGRRAGVFGTLLGVTILTIIQTLVVYNNGPLWVETIVVGLAALLGVAVSRGIESVTDMLNRPRPPRPFTAPPPAMAPGPYGPPPGNVPQG
jgi:ribose/xylose/arabinose/galactoside ABC-type transport system permease subunit